MPATMTRSEAAQNAVYVVDDAGNGRQLGDDPHAIVREVCNEFRHASRLVVWESETVVVVHSYLDAYIDEDDAEEMALEYLVEIGFFADRSQSADFIL